MSIHAAPADVTIAPVATPRRPRGRRAARTASLALAVVATVGVLTGCGGGSSTSASPGSPSSAAGSSKAPYTDAEACAWLKSSMPTATDPIMAEAGLAMDLSTFFDQHGGLAHADGYAYDQAVARGCADLRATALKQAGLESFGEI
jgi:hypothetical protein